MGSHFGILETKGADTLPNMEEIERLGGSFIL
jgi:hypothetical protein